METEDHNSAPQPNAATEHLREQLNRSERSRAQLQAQIAGLQTALSDRAETIGVQEKALAGKESQILELRAEIGK
jgi:chromosome segregation ATPase